MGKVYQYCCVGYYKSSIVMNKDLKAWSLGKLLTHTDNVIEGVDFPRLVENTATHPMDFRV